MFTKMTPSWLCPQFEKRQQSSPDCCLHIDDPPERADPATYTQAVELAAGRTPTWDSPDVVTNDSVPPYSLIDELGATIRNESSEVSAMNVRVRASYSEWGIGLERTDIGIKEVSLAPQEEVNLDYPFPDALDESDFWSFFTTVEFDTDDDRTNNFGGQAIKSVHVDEVGYEHTEHVPVGNRKSTSRQLSINVNQPSVMQVSVPNQVQLAPGERTDIPVEFDLPDGYTQPDDADQKLRLDVFATDDQTNELYDGVTLFVDARSQS